jgi:hypothetical protein
MTIVRFLKLWNAYCNPLVILLACFLTAQAFLENDNPSQTDCLISGIGMLEMNELDLQRLAKAALPPTGGCSAR